MQTPTELPQALEVPFASLVELAVEWWRLDRWANGPQGGAAAVHARHVARRLAKFLDERGLSVLDLTGRPHEPGLAAEVLDVVHDAGLREGPEIVDETVSPLVLWHGRVVRHAQVIIRKTSSQ